MAQPGQLGGHGEWHGRELRHQPHDRVPHPPRTGAAQRRDPGQTIGERHDPLSHPSAGLPVLIEPLLARPALQYVDDGPP